MTALPPLVRIGRILGLLVALTLLPLAGRSATQPSSAPPMDGSWRALTFTATKFTAAITVRLHLEAAAASADGPTRPAAGQADGCPEPGGDEQQLTVVVASRGPAMDNRYEERIWFDPADGRLRARVRRNRIDDPWLKRYCREAAGIRRFKIEPAGPAEKPQSPAAWSDREATFYPFPAEGAACAPVSDPALILHLLPRQADLRDRPFVSCVFGRQQLHRITVRSAGSETLQVSYTLGDGDGAQTVTEQLEAPVYALTSEPLPAPGEAAEPFSLLGLRRDIRIHLHPQTLLPLRVSGMAGLFGTVELNLQQATVD